jgi:glutaminyl-peptide cyclotransferase
MNFIKKERTFMKLLPGIYKPRWSRIRWLIMVLIILPAVFTYTAPVTNNAFDGEQAFQYLLLQTDLGPRFPGSPGHIVALNLLKNQLQDFGAQVELQPFMHYDSEKGITLTMNNIIGSFYLPKLSRILLCAHWDTRPFADRDEPANQHLPILGANDGASGVAVLLEIARQLQKREPAIGVDIVFFDGEDYGREGDLDNYCLGSRHFIQQNKRFFPHYAILLDMIGDAELQVPIEGYSQQFAPEITEKVWNIARDLGIEQFIPEVRNYVFDDHVILNQGGIPAIDIIDFEYPDISHRYWHTLEDTPDKCSPESLQAVGEILMNIIYNQQP